MMNHDNDAVHLLVPLLDHLYEEQRDQRRHLGSLLSLIKTKLKRHLIWTCCGDDDEVLAGIQPLVSQV
eukprot:CAMPEP_0117430070 /NCGR_PEP_ID=MMETSP0758-20121206/9593_1 /TAXON_ID=63605 /ORGANISM="Percolomonas cosmopolitus, Strain AE-1 (ATCC 50343)" /LENGTH=67 /DNA_ID=CAMNT_0005217689 /DNA_START=134 /DNA_END=337 /DNA_ORIENTATION=+